MNIDIHTVAVLLMITNALQVMALFAQYRLTRNHEGLGWWTLGTAFWALGFGFNFLRDHPVYGSFSIVANNVMFITGLAFIFIGVLRFFGRRERARTLIVVCALNALISIVFTFFKDDLIARRLNISLSAAIFFFLISSVLFIRSKPRYRSLAHFLGLIFALNGVFFIIRALSPFFAGPIGNIFSATLTQVASYIDMLIISTSWTFGFIILVNQRLNEENRESKDTLKLISNTSPDAVVITRLEDGMIFDINTSFSELLAYTSEEALGKTTTQLNIWHVPAERQRFVEEIKSVGYCKNKEAVFVRKDGSLIIGLISSKLIVLNDVLHLISVIRDYTKQKMAQEALIRSESHYRLISENTADIIWTKDIKTGRYNYVSPSVKRVRGYTQEEAQNQSIAEVLTPSSLAKVMEMVDQPPALGLPASISELEEYCKDGSIINTEVITTYALDESNQFQVIGITRDITLRKKMETALRESEAKHRVLFQDSPDAFFIITDGVFVDCNKASEVMLRCDRKQIIGKTPLDFSPEFQPDGRRSSDTIRDMLTSTPMAGFNSFEWVHRRLDGSEFYVEICISAYLLDGRQSLFTTWRDITARKRAESELQESEKRYRQLAESNTDVVWNLGLEIANREKAQNALMESETRYRLLAQNTSDVIWVIDSSNMLMLYISPSVEALLGYKPDEMTGLAIDESLIADTSSFFLESIRQQAENYLALPDFNPIDRNELVFIRKDGSSVFTETVTHCYINKNTGKVEVQGVSRDITDRKYLEDELNRQATTDELTQIYNRRHFLTVAQNEQKRSNRYQHSFSIAIIDIDHFKQINDTFGHAAGDQALKLFAGICQSIIRETDIFARLGGDEFAILFPETGLDLSFTILDRIHQSILKKSIPIENHPLKITISAGIACSPVGNETLDNLMLRADRALYKAKEAGRNQIAADR